MKIYPQEIQDGLSEKINNTSFAFLVSVAEEISVDKIKIKPRKLSLSQPDLFYMTSLLCSTGWNGNDEVFLKNELWQARKTVSNKKINSEHDEDFIIGHMIGSYVIDDEGNEIEDDRDENDLPDSFHIIDDGVIYTAWSGEEKIDYMGALLESIRNGEKFVSMECIFTDFDYAFKNDKEEFIVSRNAETSFLTKKLRAYEGSGEYKGYKLGRVPKGFVFSGKGIVSNPANPNSYILSAASLEKFSGKNISSDTNFLNSRVLTKDKEIIMSDEFKTQYEVAKAGLDKATKEIELLKSENDKLKSQFDDEIKGKLSKVEAQLATASNEKEAITNQLSVAEQTIAKLTADIEAAKAEKEELAKAAKEKEKMMKAKARQASLVQAGMVEADAEATAEKWVDVEDGLFSDFVASVAKKNESAKASEEKPNPGKESETVLETAQAEKETPSPAPNDNGVSETVLAMASIFSNNRKTKGNK